jgi:hypothetical protein
MTPPITRAPTGRPLHLPSFRGMPFRVSFSAAGPKVAGRERRHEEATRTAPEPAEPYGPRRCGGPEHTAGLSMSVGQWTRS